MKFYIALIFLSFVGVWIYRKIALRMKIIDIPNERSSHTIPTPRGAGLAVAVVWFIGITYEWLFYSSMPQYLYLASLSGIILVIVGIIDDVWDISAKFRLIAQFTVTALALYFMGGLKKVELGFYVIENTYLLTFFAFFAIIWFINLFNFLDGIDGHLGLEVVFITLTAGIIGTNAIALIIASVAVGFLFLNWPRAKVFMGDVGSTLLGFNIAVLAIYFQDTDKTSIVVWVILSSLFWFDGTLTLIRRIRNKEQILKAHKKHAYQRITQAGFSHQKTILYASAINLLIVALAVLAHYFPLYSVPLLVVDVAFLYFIDKQISKRKPFQK